MNYLIFTFYFHEKSYALRICFDIKILLIFFYKAGIGMGWDGIYCGYGIATALKQHRKKRKVGLQFEILTHFNLETLT